MKIYIKPCTKVGSFIVAERMRRYIGTIIEVSVYSSYNNKYLYIQHNDKTDRSRGWAWSSEVCVLLDTEEKRKRYTDYVNRNK